MSDSSIPGIICFLWIVGFVVGGGVSTWGSTIWWWGWFAWPFYVGGLTIIWVGILELFNYCVERRTTKMNPVNPSGIRQKRYNFDVVATTDTFD